MFKFDLSSDSYKTKADVVSTIIGIGAGSLIGSACDTFIDIDRRSGGSLYKQTKMKVGKFGLESVTVFAISNEIRKNLDDLARAWNTIADIFEISAAVENNKQAATQVEVETVETEVVNG